MARIPKKSYKKDLHDPDNHYDVVTRLEPDILECEAKWALGSITMNKASGGNGIPDELFQILKDDAVKVLHSRKFQGSGQLHSLYLSVPRVKAGLGSGRE